eukprot:12975396-Heterocapsa_arctica.AAC.1
MVFSPKLWRSCDPLEVNERCAPIAVGAAIRRNRNVFRGSDGAEKVDQAPRVTLAVHREVEPAVLPA